MIRARYRDAVLARASRSPYGYVTPADWRERRALRRLAARGLAVPALGLPGVWRVFG